MMYRRYNRLVRDNVPDIIKNSGKKVDVRVLNDTEYRNQLDDRLRRACQHCIRSHSMESIAEIIELLDAICESYHFDIEKVVKVRQAMQQSRGGYRQRLFLKGYDEPDT